MKRMILLFFLIFVLSIFVVLLIIQKPQKMIVRTFELINEIQMEKTIVFPEKILIKSPTDDFIEDIHQGIGNYVEIDTVIIQMESKEEAYQLAKSKNEYAVSLLNSGKAIQEEKKQAIELAEKKLENTKIKSPVDGYIISFKVNQHLFVTKGTILAEIVPKGSKAYIQIYSNEMTFLKNAQYVELLMMPTNEKRLLKEMVFIEQNGQYLLALDLDIDQKNSRSLNELSCKLTVSYVEQMAAWIPGDYISDETVVLENQTKKRVTVLEHKEDLVLVGGLEDKEIIVKKR